MSLIFLNYTTYCLSSLGPRLSLIQYGDNPDTTHEKEMTAVVHCLVVWRHYLLGSKFTIVTDNAANPYFKTQKKLSPKQARWQEFLAEFDYDWVHRPGRENAVADALSRKTVGVILASISLVESDFLS